MRPKRQKPERSGRRRFAKEFGRQIDADLNLPPDRPSDQPEDQPENQSEATHASATRRTESHKLRVANQMFNADFSNHEFEGADLPAPEYEGADLSADDAEPPALTHAEVLERAVRLLANREHGRKELEQKLLRRDLPTDLIVSVLDQLAQEGLQCDVRFAESYLRMRVDRGYGANKIRADLKTRRLQQSVVEQAISDCGADWTAVADAALAKKFGCLSALDIKTRAKMQRFLYQRGFAAEEIRSAMNNYESADSEL